MSLVKNNAILKISDGAGPEVFTEITPITAVNWDGIQFDNEEITPVGTASKARVFISTLYSGGNLTFTMTPYASGNAQHALVFAKSLTGETWNFKFETPAGDFTFPGIVTAKPVTPTDGAFGYDVTVMVAGEVTVS